MLSEKDRPAFGSRGSWEGCARCVNSEVCSGRRRCISLLDQLRPDGHGPLLGRTGEGSWLQERGVPVQVCECVKYP